MARSRKGFINALTELPWPVGFIAGIVIFVLIREILPVWFGRQGDMIGQGLAQASDSLAFIAWFFLIAC
jgi:restriction system protein